MNHRRRRTAFGLAALAMSVILGMGAMSACGKDKSSGNGGGKQSNSTPTTTAGDSADPYGNA